MIIVQITHGLGNQLFQYAAARRLALARQTCLKLDGYAYTQSQFRRFGLHHFNIEAGMATWTDVARLCPREGLRRALRAGLPGRVYWSAAAALQCSSLSSPYVARTLKFDPGQPLPPLLQGRVASERFYHFDPEVLACPNQICLAGFWQSEKYFLDIADLIRQELSVKTPLQGQNQVVAEQIRQTQSVSLHIRRGDKARQAAFTASNIDFCLRAIQFFRARLVQPVFFVFSDEWSWVREHLGVEAGLVFVDHNSDEANYEDLRLMSLCRHHVLAPSSFSWWGAWLNPRPDKIVVRPPDWLNLANHDFKDVFPAAWITLT